MNSFIKLMRTSSRSAALKSNPLAPHRPVAGSNQSFQSGTDVPGSLPRKRRLLIVDDEAPLCELLAIYFRHHGLEVTTASTASEGVALIEREQFDLAILDLNFDGAPLGLDLMQLWKAKHPDVPVIIFTGSDDFYAVAKKLAGHAPVLRKSGPLHALSDEVKRYVQ